MIMASAVLRMFSVASSAFGSSLGLLFPPLGGPPCALGGFQGVLGSFLRVPLGLFGVTWSSQTAPPSFFGALSRPQEALGGVLRPLLGLFGVTLRF